MTGFYGGMPAARKGLNSCQWSITVARPKAEVQHVDSDGGDERSSGKRVGALASADVDSAENKTFCDAPTDGRSTSAMSTCLFLSPDARGVSSTARDTVILTPVSSTRESGAIVTAPDVVRPAPRRSATLMGSVALRHVHHARRSAQETFQHADAMTSAHTNPEDQE